MAGTFGAVVTDDSGKLFVLSNNHVLANENALPIGSPIFQPGLLDGGDVTTDQIARLSRFITLQSDEPNTVDCAIAEALDSSLVDSDILQIGSPKGTAAATLGMAVEKFGRTSAYTSGLVSSIDTDVKVGYDLGTLIFQSQIIIATHGGKAFSAAGDSGSLILEQSSQRAVGLLFAGSASHTIANHIDAVLTSLNVRLA
jgi:hypothetical protein